MCKGDGLDHPQVGLKVPAPQRPSSPGGLRLERPPGDGTASHRRMEDMNVLTRLPTVPPRCAIVVVFVVVVVAGYARGAGGGVR